MLGRVEAVPKRADSGREAVIGRDVTGWKKDAADSGREDTDRDDIGREDPGREELVLKNVASGWAWLC